MIAKLKYYIYSICFDVKHFKFVREQLIMSLSMIGVTWFMFAMGMSLIFPVIMTIIISFMWGVSYFQTIFPHTTRMVEDVMLREKYPHMYKRFVDKERF